ncbi:MAG: hypothetical protein LBK00_04005 [Treponema sp.]|nr:hypothetical protein [Treponema sp.]
MLRRGMDPHYAVEVFSLRGEAIPHYTVELLATTPWNGSTLRREAVPPYAVKLFPAMR